jgi:hypothetical protein
MDEDHDDGGGGGWGGLSFLKHALLDADQDEAPSATFKGRIGLHTSRYPQNPNTV